MATDIEQDAIDLALNDCQMWGNLPESARAHYRREAAEALGYHVGHFSLFGTYWCDTCDSPYCEEA